MDKNKNKHLRDTVSLLVGGYTDNCQGNGIFICEFNAVSGNLEVANMAPSVINPSYLSVAPDKRFIYAVNENSTQSAVSAFDFDATAGKLEFLICRDSMGEDPCFIISDEKNVMAANYMTGSIIVFKRQPDGKISKAVQLIQHFGKGINPERQERPHVHMLAFSPDGQFVICNDLGLDKIFIYRYSATSQDKILTLTETIDVKPGSGPRHSIFGKSGKFLYLLHELDSTLATYSYEKGSLTLIAQTTIISKDIKGENSPAAVKISPDGNFLYATNRGDANTISVYKISVEGTIDLVEQQSTLGKNPRDFAIDPMGNYLLIAHQDSNDIVIFERDKTLGSLTFKSRITDICAPACLQFIAD